MNFKETKQQIEKLKKEIKHRQEVCYEVMQHEVRDEEIESNLDIFYAGKYKAYEEMGDYLNKIDMKN